MQMLQALREALEAASAGGAEASGDARGAAISSSTWESVREGLVQV